MTGTWRPRGVTYWTDGADGERVWHFQAVHHGLWDYDSPAAPNLLGITVEGRPIKAVAQVSKQVFVYTFDRVTGEPVWPIEERPVPTETNVPGEVVSSTQPFPTRPAAFECQGVTIDDLVDFTPEVREMAIHTVEGFTLGPLFTSPTLPIDGNRGTLIRPPNDGAVNRGGAAVDPDTGLLYVSSQNEVFLIPLCEPDAALGATVPYTHGAPKAERLTGRVQAGLQMPQGLPLLTRTLLIIALTAGGTTGGPRLGAYDKATGAELASVDLPAGAIGTPMTYMTGDRQYIALTVGGDPPELIAFALPLD